MHRTTVTFPRSLIRRARLKAASEGVSVSEVLRKLLGRWLREDLALEGPPPRALAVDRARATFGLWSDRDPDEYLAASRAGLADRDQELGHERVDA